MSKKLLKLSQVVKTQRHSFICLHTKTDCIFYYWYKGFLDNTTIHLAGNRKTTDTGKGNRVEEQELDRST